MIRIEIIQGDLLDQEVDAIVNAWNRNFLPWWLLIPQGVSAAIKRRAGTAPFKELARRGTLRVGEATATGPGKLPIRAIIHVAGLNTFWFATERSIRHSTGNAVKVAKELGLKSLAFPVIGSGTGGYKPARALEFMTDELSRLDADLDVRIVQYRPTK